MWIASASENEYCALYGLAMVRFAGVYLTCHRTRPLCVDPRPLCSVRWILYSPSAISVFAGATDSAATDSYTPFSARRNWMGRSLRAVSRTFLQVLRRDIWGSLGVMGLMVMVSG